MKKLIICCYLSLLALMLGCSRDNPYKESHITDIDPNYKIDQPTEPTFAKPLNQWSLNELKTRYGELQNISGLTPAQEYEMRLIDDRIRELSKAGINRITLIAD